MSYDLTNSVDKAIQQAESWTIKEVFRIARLLQKSIPGTNLEWEWEDLDYWSDFTKIQVEWNHIGHDEKTWLSITKGKERVAYLRIDFPLLILLEKYAQEIQNNKDFATMEMVFTPSFGRQIYKINKTIIENIFLRKNISSEIWRTLIADLDPESFSIQELWWSTIIPPRERVAKYDLTDLLLQSNLVQEKWTSNRFFSIVNKIAELSPESYVSYESGEAWATISQSEDCLFIVGVYVPIVFTLDKYIDRIQNLVNSKEVVIISVNSFEIEECRMNILLLKKEFTLWNLELFPAIFSIFDLIFFTI